jgi:MFS transporter, DHA1 family, tetracycline resistance protein
MPRRPLLILFLTVFLDLVGFGIVIPILPLYAERFGAGPIAIGWLLAVYSLMQFLVAPWWGQLSDRVGRRPILLMSLFGSAASYLLFGLAHSLAFLFVARALGGLTGASVGVAQAYIADVTPPEQRARGMGMIGAAFGLGFIFGPAIGGLLVRFGPAAPFLGAAALTLANALLAVVYLPEPARRAGSATAATPGLAERLRALTRLRGRGRTERLYAISFLLTFAFACMEATFALWGNRRWGLEMAEITYLFVYLGVLVVVAQGFLVGRMVRLFGERTTAVLGSVLLAVGLATMPFAPSWGMLALALAALGLGQGVTVPAVTALISRGAAPGEQGRMLSVSHSLSALGRVIGPVVGGFVFYAVGIAAPYLIGAVLVVAALLVLRTLRAVGPVPA